MIFSDVLSLFFHMIVVISGRNHYNENRQVEILTETGYRF